MHRCSTTATILLVAFASCAGCVADPTEPVEPAASAFPLSGTGVASIDSLFVAFLVRRDIPGGALAVVRNGRLVVARGYGLRQPDMEDVVQPEYRGRIASVSKPITATAIMKLVESGQLSLDARVFPDLLADMWNQVGTDVGDNRLADITVRHLLRHQGGWDRQRAGDPPFQLAAIAAGEGVSLPPGTDAMIRWVLRKPLQVTPGTVPYYSNFGYVVLARVIEQVTGQSYGAYVRSLLQQSGAEGFEIGGNRLSQLAADELRYFAQGVEGTLVPAIDGGDSGPVPVQYGGFDLAVLDGAGGWIASVIDLVRFGSLVDGENGIPDVLSAGTLEQMRHGAVSLSGGQYGFGWFVSGQALHHTGRLPGSASRMVILPGGTIYAAILNSSQPDEVTFLTDFVTTLEGAVAGVANWPAHDLFAEY